MEEQIEDINKKIKTQSFFLCMFAILTVIFIISVIVWISSISKRGSYSISPSMGGGFGGMQ